MNVRVLQVLLQSLITAEGLIASLTLKGWSVDKQVLQVLIKSLIAAEGLITSLTVKGWSMCR